MLIFRAFLPVLAFCGAVCAAADSSAANAYAPPGVDDYTKMATDSVLSQLSSPDSAQFRNVKLHVITKKLRGGPSTTTVVCGEVKAKAADGYTDYLRFIFKGRESTIGVDSDEWQENCTD